MMKPLLIFDYDGTLHNKIRIYESAFRNIYEWLTKEYEIPFLEISTKRIQGWLGMNSKDMWNDFMPELSEQLKEEAGRKIGELMVQQIEDGKAQWYENTKSTLDQLKKEGYPMVILSNCKIAYKNANWKQFHMDQWFLDFYDCQTYQFAPKTEIIQHIKEKYKEKSIVIGDRRSDLEGARAAGSLFVGCTYGFALEGELDEADYLIKDVGELVPLLKIIG